jgi:hypothetical protein
MVQATLPTWAILPAKLIIVFNITGERAFLPFTPRALYPLLKEINLNSADILV